MLISNVTILFSNSSPKVPKNKAFLVSNLGIFIFSRDFPIKQIRGCWFQIWQYCFQLPDRKYPNLQFLVSNLRIFILHQTLHTDKFEGVDFKYDNGFFEFPSENTPIELFFFFFPKCKYFLSLHETSHTEKFEGTDFESGNRFFQVPAKNTQIQNFLWKLKSFSFFK